MRLYEAKEVWRHGFKFTIRRASMYSRTMNYRGKSKRSNRLPPYVLAMNGRFLCRVRDDQLKRWINHFALEALVKP